MTRKSKEELVFEIIEVLRKYVSQKEKVLLNTKIFHDLRIYGDDAYEFLEELRNKYNVINKNFRASEYFPAEGEMPPKILILIWPKLLRRWKPLTAVDLAEIIMKGESA